MRRRQRWRPFDLPIANLPETFELETTLHLGDNEWTVVSAEPRTKLEFASSGKLILAFVRSRWWISRICSTACRRSATDFQKSPHGAGP